MVQNLNLTNVNIQANPNLGTTYQKIGTLAAENDGGTIDNVHATGTINGLTVGPNISGLSAGGLVGQNGFFNGTTFTGTIQNSSAAVNVTLGNALGCTINSCSTNFAGGLVGDNPGTITGSSASGTIVVGANSQAGGLVGVNQWPAINNGNASWAR